MTDEAKKKIENGTRKLLSMAEDTRASGRVVFYIDKGKVDWEYLEKGK